MCCNFNIIRDIRIARVVVVFLCLFFANDVKGQGFLLVDGAMGFGFFSDADRLGVKAGVVYSGNEQGFGTNASVDVAIQEEWYLGEWISFVLNIGYMEKSFQYRLAATDIQQARELNTRLNFFYIDYLLKFKKNSDGWSPNVFVGPRVDFMISHDSDFDNAVGGSTEKDVSNVALTYGFGFERSVGSFIFGASVSHYYDFSTNFSASFSGVSPGIHESF